MQILVGVFVLAMAIPFFGQPRSASSLEQVMTDYVAAFNAKDPIKLASFYTEDGELMAPGASLFKGREALETALQMTFQASGTLALTSLESEVIGNRAYDSGAFTVTLTSEDDSGQLEVIGGRYLAVFKRVGNEWKLAHHMFHTHATDLPPP